MGHSGSMAAKLPLVTSFVELFAVGPSLPMIDRMESRLIEGREQQNRRVMRLILAQIEQV